MPGVIAAPQTAPRVDGLPRLRRPSFTFCGLHLLLHTAFRLALFYRRLIRTDRGALGSHHFVFRYVLTALAP